MRLALCTGILLFTLAGAGSFAQNQTFTTAEQAVIDVHRARMEAAAKRDIAAWTRYVSEDCLFSGDDGSLLNKAQMLAHYKKIPAEYDRAMEPRDEVVHLYSDTATLSYRTTNHEQFDTFDLVTEQRRTETLVRQNGAWMLVAIQWGNLPINFRKPIAAEGKSYSDYVGQYQSRPLDEIETISIKDGRLWSQIGDDGAWVLPLGGDTFFYKEDIGSFTFTRDAHRRVTGYLYRSFDNQEIPTRKIK